MKVLFASIRAPIHARLTSLAKASAPDNAELLGDGFGEDLAMTNCSPDEAKHNPDLFRLGLSSLQRKPTDLTNWISGA